jgi:hypothetical protein
VRVVVAVPDSWIGGVMDVIEREPDMTVIRATHEEEALAIACGARLGGARAVLIPSLLALETEPDVEGVEPPEPINPPALKHRFMSAVGAPFRL